MPTLLVLFLVVKGFLVWLDDVADQEDKDLNSKGGV